MPENTSKSVVLPAPFGPMRPSTSPLCASTETFDSAAIPPNATEKSSAESDVGVELAASETCQRVGSTASPIQCRFGCAQPSCILALGGRGELRPVTVI